MLKSKLRYLMADHQINSIQKLITDTSLSRNTLNKLYRSENLETLGLNVNISTVRFLISLNTSLISSLIVPPKVKI